MYLEMAAEDDKKMTEAWTAGADSILIFVSNCLLRYALANSMGHRLVYSPRPSPL
jgi:hypothetical protein